MNAHDLKQLQVRRTKVEAELKAANQDRESLSKRIHDLKNELNSLDTKIKNFSKSKPMVSEHAMLRYIERVIGIDLEDVKQQILTETNVKAIEFAGNCTIKCNNIELIVKDRCVVSVVDKK